MREEIKKIRDLMESAEYVTDPAIATSVHLAMTLRKPLAHRGARRRRQDRGGQGDGARARHAAHSPAVLRGSGRRPGPLRVELPQADPPHQARGALRRVSPQRRSTRSSPSPFSSAVRCSRPSRPRRAARAPDRRNRPCRRGVRSLPSRSPFRLPGDDPRDRHDHRGRAALRDPDLEPQPGAVGRAPPPLPLPLGGLPRLREGSANRHA